MATLIHKTLNANEPTPNLTDYRTMRAAFSWDIACAESAELPHGGLNIAFEAVDRWVATGQGEAIALRWLGKNGERREVSYTELARLSNRFANSLEQLGIGPGDRVCILAGRIPELYIAALGTLKVGAVFCPLFSAFGPEPVQVRLVKSQARVLVATTPLYQRKIREQRDKLPDLEHILLTDSDGNEPGTRSFHALLEAEVGTIGLHLAPSPRIGRCCISRVAPPERPRARSMCTKPWLLIG